MSGFPFYDCGFVSNPFRVLTDEEWAAVAVLPPFIEKTLKNTTEHLQIIGQRGRGKSTTLRKITVTLQQQGQAAVYEYLPPGQRCFVTSLAGHAVFMLDEMQRLWWWERWRLLSGAIRHDVRLIVSSHTNYAWFFRLLGQPVKTIRLEIKGEQHLAKILTQRIHYFALDDPPRVTFCPDAVHYLSATFGSDLRQVEMFLYEFFQYTKPTIPIQKDHLLAFASSFLAKR